MDDQDVPWVDFRKLDIFGQEVALEAEWTGNVIGMELVFVRLDDAVLGGQGMVVAPLCRMIDFLNELVIPVLGLSKVKVLGPQSKASISAKKRNGLKLLL